MENKSKNDLTEKVVGFLGNGYNPLLQKPTSLEPVNPAYPVGWGSYIYFGPPPDFGGSFGAYEDSQGRKQVSIKSSKAYSIYDGTPLSCRSELTPEEREVLLSQLDEAAEEHKCQHCRSELVLSCGTDLKVENLHCPFCASALDGALDKVKKCISKIEEINMKKVQVKAEVDAAKEAMKVPAPNELNKDDKAVIKDAMAAPTPNEINEENFTKPEPVEMLNPEDSLKVVKEGEVKVEEVKAAAVKKARMKRAIAAISMEKAKRKKIMQARLQASAKSAVKPVVTAKQGLNLSKEDMATLTRELRVLAAKDPVRFNAVKKNKALASLCAEVEAKLVPKADRIAARAELKVLAEQNPEQALALEEQLKFEAPEILIDDSAQIIEPAAPELTPEGAPVAPAAECTCPPAVEPMAEEVQPVSEEMPEGEEEKEEMEEKAESMQVELLESNLSNLKAEKVEMSLHGQTTSNPFWNVTVNSQPVGRIYLQDQQDAESIRASFVQDSYAQNFGLAMTKAGVEKMLTLAKAKLFAHKMDETEMAKRIEAKVREEVKAEVADKVATLRADFLDAVAVAMVASDKNFYGTEENANVLKGQIFNNMVAAGVDVEEAVESIQASFEKAPEYFDFIISKAVEIMDMSKDSRETFTKTVAHSGTLEIPVTKEPTMAELIQANASTTSKTEVRETIRKGLKRN